MKEKPTYEELERRIQELEKIESENKSSSKESLWKNENQFRMLYEKAPLGYQSLDEDGHFIVVNKTWLDTLGYTKEEVIGKSFADFLHPDWRDHFKENFPKFKAIGEVLGVEFEMVKKNGDLILVSFTGKISRDEKGNFQQTHCIFHDITERKQVEKELFLKKNIIKSSSCAIATCDLEGNMTYGNPYFQKQWGFDNLEEFLGKPFQKLWLIEDQYEAIMKTLQSKGTWAGELKGIRKDGSLFDVQISAATVLDDTGNPIALTSTSVDITERKATEVKFQQLQKVESLSRMAGAIAHHFNNRLSVVMGNLELVLEDLPEDAKIRKRLLQSMMAAQKAAALSRQMLTYLGQIQGRHEPIDLSEVCRQSLLLLQLAIPKGMIQNVDFPVSGPVICANEGQINQVLANLITNSWESIPSHQGSISLSVRTVTQENIPTVNRFPIDWQPKCFPHACIEVSDTGCGISHQDIEKLFDPFFTTKFTGRGMGLPVVIGIVKAQGGGITVDSEPGSGSVFRIFLPVSTEKIPFPPEQEKPATALARKVESGGTVLLIEDEETVRNMVKTMLIRLGYKVIEAQDGVEAVDMFQQCHNKICCVLSDLTMPRMNGWETLTELRKMSANVPVILASGHDKDVVMAGDHPDLPQAFLNKPYSMSALKEALSKAMGAFQR